jgi:hypothetical protein
MCNQTVPDQGAGNYLDPDPVGLKRVCAGGKRVSAPLWNRFRPTLLLVIFSRGSVAMGGKPGKIASFHSGHATAEYRY